MKAKLLFLATVIFLAVGCTNNRHGNLPEKKTAEVKDSLEVMDYAHFQRKLMLNPTFHYEHEWMDDSTIVSTSSARYGEAIIELVSIDHRGGYSTEYVEIHGQDVKVVNAYTSFLDGYDVTLTPESDTSLVIFSNYDGMFPNILEDVLVR